MNATIILAIATWCNGLTSGGLTAIEDVDAVNQQVLICKRDALNCVNLLTTDKRRPCRLEDALVVCLEKK